MTNNKRILVTGASGFIGGRIVEILHLTNLYKVRAGFKNYSSCARIGRFNVDLCKLNVMNTDQIKKAMEDVSVVIHCAYGSEGVTTEGTRNVLKIASEKNIDNFIHLSTIEVYGKAIGIVNEKYPCHYTGNPYGDSKLEAEKICSQYYENGVPITILRLPIVYGPFSRNWTVNITKLLLNNKWKVDEKYLGGKCNLLYVDDLFRAIICSIDNDKAIGEIFNVNGQEIITWADYIAKLKKGLGLVDNRTTSSMNTKFSSFCWKPVRSIGSYLRKNHIGLMKKIGERSYFANNLMNSVENKLKETPSPDQLELYSKDVIYDSEKIKNMLGFIPMFKVDKGLSVTLEWIKHHANI